MILGNVTTLLFEVTLNCLYIFAK